MIMACMVWKVGIWNRVCIQYLECCVKANVLKGLILQSSLMILMIALPGEEKGIYEAFA